MRNLLETADIRVGGHRPWDLQVHDPRFYGRVLAGGDLALGESYMDGWWDCDALDEFVARALRADLRRAVGRSFRTRMDMFAAWLSNRQRPSRAFQVGRRHYDLGNDLFEAMLDSRLTYSCAYWDDADSLERAQTRKLDLICRKIRLGPGQRVLDIGSGWGSFVGYAAEEYGAVPTGLTVSLAQAEYARRRYAGRPMEVLVADYRDHLGTYDHVVSVGMFEHVGVKNYRRFMRVAHDAMQDDGLMLLHTIVANRSSRTINAWTEKYIFPNGALPSPAQIARATEGLFVIEDVQSMGVHYDRTLRSWHANFARAWPDLSGSYDERFFRMWTYYLLSSAGAFRARHIGVWQLVFSKGGVEGGYRAVR